VDVGLPETIAVQHTEESAGYLAMTPVVKQTFKLGELVDMVVSVVGKSAEQVEHVLLAGAASYNGYHYKSEGFPASPAELAGLLATFPDDDPSRVFQASAANAGILEIGGGTETVLVEIPRESASARRLFRRRSAWEVLLAFAKEFPPRYEKYDYARRGDRFRIALHFDAAQRLLREMIAAAPHKLRSEWRRLRPPSAIIYILKRAPGGSR
jgi:hypothetical protein